MQAVILAAGQGTRLWPLTEHIPKPLLAVAGKPLIVRMIEGLRSCGMTDLVVVVGWRSTPLREALAGLHDVSIRCAIQKEQRGTGHALLQAKDLVDGPFLCLNGDIVATKADLASFCAASSARGPPLIAAAKVPDPRGYGVLEVEGDRLVGLHEKPKRPVSNLINAGFYAFDPRVFELLERLPPSPRGELELTSAIERLIPEGFGLHLLDGPWIDVGRPWDLLDANALFLRELPPGVSGPGTVEDGVEVRGALYADEGARVRRFTWVEGPVYVGRGSDVGPFTFLRGPVSIGDGCRVGAYVELKNTVVGDRSNVPHHNYVGDSVIGRGCNLGSGTKVANLRLDGGNVRAMLKGEQVDTGRRKLGVIMGDGVKTGINAMIEVGTVVGGDVFIGPGAKASGLIASGARIY